MKIPLKLLVLVPESTDIHVRGSQLAALCEAVFDARPRDAAELSFPLCADCLSVLEWRQVHPLRPPLACPSVGVPVPAAASLANPVMA